MVNPQASPYPGPGEILDGKYRIERMLGEGGMGAVMEAFHITLKSPVALKFMSPAMVGVPGAVERFINEGVAARGIHSDHVVRIDDVVTLPSGQPFIVMEKLHGCDLSELLEREAKDGFEVGRAIHFVLQILRGLHVAHSAGIVHRDLKPSNAFVITKDGETDFVKLLDFGISKISQEGGEDAGRLTATNTGLGTPLYMSPEQARNARGATARSDLYSVSAILYELLTGRTPYVAESPNDLLFKLFTSEPDPILSVRPDLPEGLARLIHQGLSKDAAERPASALEYAELLSPYADARSTDVLARIRAAAGGVPASVLLAERAASQLPPIPTAGLTVPLAKGAPAIARTAASGAAASNAATQLGMQVSDGATQSSSVGLSLSAKLALAVGVAAIVGGGAILLTRSPATASGTASPPPPDPPATTSASPPPSETAALPQVVPVPASATASATASASAAQAPSSKGGPAKPPPNTKKNPFGVGIVQ